MSIIKDNGGPLVVGAAVLAIVGGYIELRLPSDEELQAKVDAKFVAAGTVSTDRVTSIEKDMAETRETHAADSTRMDGKIERIVDILLEE